MESVQNSGIVVVVATLTLIFIVVFIVVFVLYHKRKVMAKQALIDLLENEVKNDLQAFKVEVYRRLDKLER